VQRRQYYEGATTSHSRISPDMKVTLKPLLLRQQGQHRRDRQWRGSVDSAGVLDRGKGIGRTAWGPKNRRRNWRRRRYLFSQWDTKDRRRKRSHRNSVANRNHNRQGINTWIGVKHRQPPHGVMTAALSSLPSRSSSSVWTSPSSEREADQVQAVVVQGSLSTKHLADLVL
jgi:hypothetical protein